MIKVGITGMMGSGKTTVCRIFRLLGIPVYQADDAAKRLMTENKELKSALISNFGPVFNEDGNLDTKKLAGMVFGKPEAVHRLNSLVHPRVESDFMEWVSRNNAPYVIKEAALIFESGTNARLDAVITVDSPMETALERIIRRDGLSRDDIAFRMSHQLPQEEKKKRADFVIHNDGSESLILQVMSIHRKLLDGFR